MKENFNSGINDEVPKDLILYFTIVEDVKTKKKT
jgi:hypothetical protein